MIIKSLLDVDFYKFSMLQLVYFKHKDVEVEYSFINRTKKDTVLNHLNLHGERLTKELIYELNHIQTLRFKDDEIRYLKGLGIFKDEFLDFLRDYSLPKPVVKDFMDITVTGKWVDTILWETILLSVVNELYHKSLVVDYEETWSTGLSKLQDKIKLLSFGQYKSYFSDFGTRRRFSQKWHETVVKTLKWSENNTLGGIGFMGTSNVYLAKKYDLIPIGTFAHELFMGYSGIYNDDLVQSHRNVLNDWQDFYGDKLSIALTDTYGSEFFFDDFTREQALTWSGVRHDSGDPFEFGNKVIAYYISNMIDPKTKTIVFSDGLDISLIKSLTNAFSKEINVTFGWGTSLTNDLLDETLSLVVKITKSNGHGTVKLSDNLNKAMGTPENIERFKKEFNYNNIKKEELNS